MVAKFYMCSHGPGVEVITRREGRVYVTTIHGTVSGGVLDGQEFECHMDHELQHRRVCRLVGIEPEKNRESDRLTLSRC